MRILFKVFPQKSHFNATFPLARALSGDGHVVVYAGVHQLESHAKAQGFDYFIEDEDVYPYVEHRRESPKLTFWSVLRNWRQVRRSAKVMRSRLASCYAFGKLVRAVKPNLIFVDSPYTFFALSLYKQGTPFAILESMMNLDRAAGCPPLDTAYVPDGSWLSQLICELHWRRYFLKRAILGFVGLRVDFNRRFVLKMADACGVDRSVISFDRYFHLGLRDVPEFILSPRALDFPRQPSENQYYVGTSVDVNREEVASDYWFEKRFTAMVEERKRGTPLVYCSLGTAGWRYKGAERFLHRVVEATRGRNWNLILVIGNQFPLEPFIRAPVNVRIFQTVPQMRVLRHADLMITHGGMNSITECIVHGVPMLVYPGTNEIDQAGNAARVVLHAIGLKGRLGSASIAEIAWNIHAVLGDHRYKQSVRGLAVALSASRFSTIEAHDLAEKVCRRSWKLKTEAKRSGCYPCSSDVFHAIGLRK
jgi:UDP:flavonoid glycosyltransferase YjiC (YdhE family)